MILPSATNTNDETSLEKQQTFKEHPFHHLLHDDPSPPSPPSVENTTEVGGWVWIVMFGFVITLSLLSNLTYLGLVCSNRKKRTNLLHLLLLFLFFINILEYCLLGFEFSLGMDHLFPYSESLCSVYQVTRRSMPILQALTLLVILVYTVNHFVDNSAHQQNSRPIQCNKWPKTATIFAILGGMAALCALFAIPTVRFARLVTFPGEAAGASKVYCEIDPGQMLGLKPQTLVSLYYLIYSSLLTFWIPLLISVPLLVKIVRSKCGEKFPEISLVLSTSLSFYAFFVLHASTVFARHSMDILGVELTTYQSWMLKVVQSLFLLLGFFWHFSRSALVILLDFDLKASLMSTPCCGILEQQPDHLDYDLHESESVLLGTNRNNSIIRNTNNKNKNSNVLLIPLQEVKSLNELQELEPLRTTTTTRAQY